MMCWKEIYNITNNQKLHQVHISQLKDKNYDLVLLKHFANLFTNINGKPSARKTQQISKEYHDSFDF